MFEPNKQYVASSIGTAISQDLITLVSIEISRRLPLSLSGVLYIVLLNGLLGIIEKRMIEIDSCIPLRTLPRRSKLNHDVNVPFIING